MECREEDIIVAIFTEVLGVGVVVDGAENTAFSCFGFTIMNVRYFAQNSASCFL